jgi:autotransporter strand-loop-strand O-heptosyltransferase
MPTSYTVFKEEIKTWFIDNVPTTKRILDVGPGEGTYFNLLSEVGYRIDAIEIWRPYIEQYQLREKYDNVYLGDILEFNIDTYDFIILDDVLEHIPPAEAIAFINMLELKGKEYLVAVPYTMEQGEYEGNIHETHYQADLTPELMKERYPSLECLYSNQWYGYYCSVNKKVKQAYVLYATESYHNTVAGCVESIRAFSELPIFVYLLNFNAEVEGATTIPWICNIKDSKQTQYIDRFNADTYNILIQRPDIIKDCLLKYADTVVYIDSDSVATSNIDSIFTMFPDKCSHPYFVEGMYDWLQYNDRGGVWDETEYHKSLEAPACALFNVNQFVRKRYRQTGYFIASKWNIAFLDEWSWMCNNPQVKHNTPFYAPYNEETILNVLLWKYNIQIGLPYLYVNGNLETIKEVYEEKETEDKKWFRLPENKNSILFFHGEKNYEKMIEMRDELLKYKTTVKKKILFLAPHLSTGGMPAFLLKRIEALMLLNQYEIFVVEYEFYTSDFIVQREQIIKLIGKDHFFTLVENKSYLVEFINKMKFDVVHIDEMSERLNSEMVELLYSEDRKYRIVETCHDVSFTPEEKIYTPDAYAFCSPYHIDTFANNIGDKTVIEFPIEKKKFSSFGYLAAKKELGFSFMKMNVVNIGLWTPGKNQAEGIAIARLFPNVNFHFVGNQAGNFQDYWEPLMKDLPSNVTVWGERKDTDIFLKATDVFMFNSTWECNPLVLREAIGYGLPILARNLPQYKDMFTDYIIPLDMKTVVSSLKKIFKDRVKYKIPTDNTIKDFANAHQTLYENLMKNKIPNFKQNRPSYKINQHFIGQPFLEITGASKSKFGVNFFDMKTDELVHYDTIEANHWIKLNKEYYIKYRTDVYKDNVLVYTNIFNLNKRRVYIAFDSQSLGDTIAWIPYVEEFRKKHNCKVIVSTYKNFLFKDVYPELEFVEPDTVVHNIYAMYKLGWFYNSDKEPVLPNTIPLQQTACNILGLEYEEIRPRIITPKTMHHIKKYVTIATNSTSGCKFWTRENWQEVITYLYKKGYTVVNTSLEDNPFENCVPLQDKSMENTMYEIFNSEFFIGLSSGLTWLAWALGKEVIMISNFTNEELEFKCHRPVVKSVCNSCWNNPNFKFDKGDWDWCPIHKNTEKQFECQKSITAEMIIEEVNKLITLNK